MTLPGPKPKNGRLTRHRNKPAHDWLEVPDVPFSGAPRLPSRQPDGRTWPTWTRRWWQTFSTMPHCALWAPSDWEFAFDTAALKGRFHEGGTTALATEIRYRERVLGTTADFRRDLRIRYVDPQPVTNPEVTRLDDYREL